MPIGKYKAEKPYSKLKDERYIPSTLAAKKIKVIEDYTGAHSGARTLSVERASNLITRLTKEYPGTCWRIHLVDADETLPRKRLFSHYEMQKELIALAKGTPKEQEEKEGEKEEEKPDDFKKLVEKMNNVRNKIWGKS